MAQTAVLCWTCLFVQLFAIFFHAPIWPWFLFISQGLGGKILFYPISWLSEVWITVSSNATHINNHLRLPFQESFLGPSLASCCLFRHPAKWQLCIFRQVSYEAVSNRTGFPGSPSELEMNTGSRHLSFPLRQLLDIRQKDEQKVWWNRVTGFVPKPFTANMGSSAPQGNYCFLPVSRASLFPRQVSHGLCEAKMTEAGLLYKMPALLNPSQALSPGFTDFQMHLDSL